MDSSLTLSSLTKMGCIVLHSAGAPNKLINQGMSNVSLIDSYCICFPGNCLQVTKQSSGLKETQGKSRCERESLRADSRVSQQHVEHLVCPLAAWPTHCDSCCVVASWSLSAWPPALKAGLISVWASTALCNSCSHWQQTEPLSYSGPRDESEACMLTQLEPLTTWLCAAWEGSLMARKPHVIIGNSAALQSMLAPSNLTLFWFRSTFNLRFSFSALINPLIVALAWFQTSELLLSSSVFSSLCRWDFKKQQMHFCKTDDGLCCKYDRNDGRFVKHCGSHKALAGISVLDLVSTDDECHLF